MVTAVTVTIPAKSLEVRKFGSSGFAYNRIKLLIYYIGIY